MTFYIKVCISPYIPLQIIFAKPPPNYVSFAICYVMHLFIKFISYLFFSFQKYLILYLRLLWGTIVPHLRLELGKYASRLLRALKRKAHVSYNSSIVKIKVLESWPLWEEHLPGM